MKVLFYLSVKEHTGVESIELSNMSILSDVLVALEEKFGSAFGEYLRADETCFYLVDGKAIIGTGGFNTRLEENSVVEILPVVDAG